MSVSVLTLVRGRRAHLANLIAGLNASRRKPDELVIAYMQPAAHIDLPSTDFPIREVFVSGDAMPLAAARNRAAAAASGKQLIFLDVDCVPSPTLVERYVETGSEPGGIRLGEVLYLPAGAITDGIDFVALDRIGKRHPDKPPIALGEIRPTPTHGELWGLSFGISAADWTRAGGMDERYVGYGGEETDFAARLERAGVAMWWVGGARVSSAPHRPHAGLPAFRRDHPQCAVVSGDMGAMVHAILAWPVRRERFDRVGCGYDNGLAPADRGGNDCFEDATGDAVQLRPGACPTLRV
ncbi:glycosyltransferase family 2 protein [Sphingomonas sp. LR55]|uniref:glycosyltransferase family 2 protein n=1 Tax=Sphingomonas sp. LR55 TaxID=3050231 RepID=UPI002FE20042